MMNKFIITIGRQIGSGGKAIADELGKKLGVPVYDKELIYMAAMDSGIAPEFFEKADERGKKSVFPGFFNLNSFYFNSLQTNNLSNDKLFDIQSRTIRDIAQKQSSIFVGRCADYILRDMPCLISIFITAHKQDRIDNLSERLHIAQAKAESILETADKSRSEYYNYYTFKTWGAAASYHLCINSSVLGIDRTVRSIIRFIEESGYILRP